MTNGPYVWIIFTLKITSVYTQLSIRYFFQCSDRILDRSNLGSFCLTVVGCIQSPLWKALAAGVRQVVTLYLIQEAERNKCWCYFTFIQPHASTFGIVLSIIQVELPPSVKPFRIPQDTPKGMFSYHSKLSQVDS